MKNFFIYLRSLIFIAVFLAILFGFDILMRIGNLFSHNLFLSLQYSMCKAIRLALTYIGGVTFEINVDNNLPTNKPLIVISNHQSMYDVSLLTEVFRAHQPRFISKKELAKLVPAVSYIARNNKTALIDRKNRAQALAEIKKVSESTKNDKAAIIVFPEGTRARDGQIKPFKVGGLQTILEAIPDAIIVPIAITNSWKILKNNLLPIPDGIYLTVQSLPIIKWEKQFQTNEEIQLFINSIQKQISDAVS